MSFCEINRALIRSIQVVQDGGKWIILHERLPSKELPGQEEYSYPKEAFSTNCAEFESHFDPWELQMIKMNDARRNQAVAAATNVETHQVGFNHCLKQQGTVYTAFWETEKI